MYAKRGRLRMQSKNNPQTAGWVIGYPEEVVKLDPTDNEVI
jgi:hypothetical protein